MTKRLPRVFLFLCSLRCNISSLHKNKSKVPNKELSSKQTMVVLYIQNDAHRKNCSSDIDTYIEKIANIKGAVLHKTRPIIQQTTQSMEFLVQHMVAAIKRAVQSMGSTKRKTQLPSHHNGIVQSNTKSVRYLLQDELLGKGHYGKVVGAKKEVQQDKWLRWITGFKYAYSDVAIKMQPSHRPGHTRHESRLNIECDILRRFGHHTNIIGFIESIHAPVWSPDKVYIVMEQASVDVLTFLKMFKKPDAAQSDLPQQIMLGLLSALDYLHNAGIAHCDVKLENILIQSSCFAASKTIHPTSRIEASAIRLCDFGLAREATDFPGYEIYSRGEEHDKQGWSNDDRKQVLVESVQGSSGYMAPEVLSKQRRKMRQPYEARRADMYSTGCVLFATVFWRMYSRKSWKCKKLLFEDQSEMPERHSVGILLQSLLRTEPCARISAANALKHSWFQYAKSK